MEKGKVIVGQHPIKHTDGAVLDDQRAAAFYTEYMNIVTRSTRNRRLSSAGQAGTSASLAQDPLCPAVRSRGRAPDGAALIGASQRPHKYLTTPRNSRNLLKLSQPLNTLTTSQHSEYLSTL